MAEIDRIPARKDSKLSVVDAFATSSSLSFLGSQPVINKICSMPSPERPTTPPVLLDIISSLLQRYALAAYPIHPDIGIVIIADAATIVSIINPHAALAIVLYWGDARNGSACNVGIWPKIGPFYMARARPPPTSAGGRRFMGPLGSLLGLNWMMGMLCPASCAALVRRRSNS